VFRKHVGNLLQLCGCRIIQKRRERDLSVILRDLSCASDSDDTGDYSPWALQIIT
jgi:hypothetical protein